MPILIAMLRGVNVGGNHKMPMAQLVSLCESLGFGQARTFIQSGNVVFEAADAEKAARCLEAGIEREFGFRSPVIVRTAAELKKLVKRHPFPGQDGAKVQVTFLESDPGEAVRESVRAIDTGPEQITIEGREMVCHFPDGMGKTKLPFAKIERMLGCPVTTRNWNSVEKLLAMAEAREV